MDNQLFESLIGGPQPEDGSADRSNMASALRGQSDLGMLFSIAPGLEQVGQNMQKGALSQAKQIGDRRQQGLTRTRQELLDKRKLDQYNTGIEREDEALELAAEKLKYERSGWTDVESYTDDKGNIALYGLKDGRGSLVKIPDSDTLTPYNKPTYSSTAAKRVYIPGTDASYLEYPDKSITFNNEKFATMDDFRAAHPELTKDIQNLEITEVAGQAGAKKLADLGAEDTNTAFANARQTRSVIKGMNQLLGNARAVDPNQESWMTYLPTLQSETALQETLIRQLAVQNIPADMRPFSDADKEFFVSSISPNLPREEYIKYFENKIQGLEISAEIQDEIAQTYLEHGRGGVLTAKQRDALKQRVKDITGSYEVLKPSGEAVFGMEDSVSSVADPIDAEIEGYPAWANTDERKAAYDRQKAKK